MLVISISKVVHISRANTTSGRVSTECGRDMRNCGHYSGTPAEIRKTMGQQLPLLYGQFQYTLCSKCGTIEDFAKTQEESQRKLEENKRERADRYDKIKSRIEKTKAAIRATIAAEVLYGLTGVDDIENEEWGVKFTLKGHRMELRIDEKEIKSIIEKIYEEV